MFTQGYLFNSQPIRQVFEGFLAHARTEIGNMSDDDIINCDVTLVRRSYIERFQIDLPKLGEITGASQPSKSGREPTTFYTTYFIRFSGFADALGYIPIVGPCAKPIGEVVGSEIQVGTATVGPPDPQQLKFMFEQNLQCIRRYLSVLESDLARCYEELGTNLAAALTQRRAGIDAAGRVAAGLGYPLRKREDAERFAVPLTRKNLSLDPVSHAFVVPAKVDPYIEEKIYEEVLNVLASMALLMERNPTTFSRLEEEMIRDHFLLQLNGQFQGKATDETFNASGKTDILLREANKNIFIAECKFWDGPKSLSDAIEQLFTYLTWRDSRSSVLVFSKRKDFIRVLKEAETTLKGHPRFKEQKEIHREGAYRAVMVREGDDEQKIDLTVLLFNIPSK